MKISIYKEGEIDLPFHNISRRNIKKFIKKTCAALNLKKAEVTVVICDNNYIRQINRDYRKKNKPTDVISFPGYSLSIPNITMQSEYLGEIYLSLEKALENAMEFNNNFTEEVKWLIVHGILHLTGYDHEKSDEDDIKMREKEKEILKLI
ncbi:MAG: rRNA maturation RNase YbeY [Spirochaetes bacterium]|nr:rRNA maturation RNase YbeY [Spirochaetota bacterium]